MYIIFIFELLVSDFHGTIFHKNFVIFETLHNFSVTLVY